MIRSLVLLPTLAWLLLLVPAGLVWADDLLAALKPGGMGRVVEVVDGDTVVLESGVQVRLVGIQAPKLPLGRPNFAAWPLAAEAKAALAALVQERAVTLFHGGREIDRHGRALAHLETTDGVWLQGELLRRGFARVYSFRDNRALVSAMLAIEREARGARRGIWADPYYRVLSPDEAARHVGSYQIVEGQVRDAAVVRRQPPHPATQSDRPNALKYNN